MRRTSQINPEVTGMSNEGIVKRRSLTGITGLIWKSALFLITFLGIIFILGIHQKLGIVVYKEQYIGLFLGLVLFSAFLWVPAVKKTNTSSIVPWYDWILALGGLAVGLTMMLFYPEMLLKTTNLPIERIIVSVAAVLLILEALRRVIGWILFSIVSISIIYALFAPYMPGAFEGNKIQPSRLFNYLYLDYNSMIGLLSIASTIALAFILFGQVLILFKGGDILNNIAVNSFGRYRGGPAKAAVVGSSLIGTVTGNPVTNVMLSGSVTIPLMKKSGFRAEEAGAIESVASAGGSKLPPVMGISAFIMAELLAEPYPVIALAALVPAILYYLCIFMQVDLIAARRGLGKLHKSEMVPWKTIMNTFWLILPAFFFLIYFLFIVGYTPPLAGLYSAGIGLVFLLLQRDLWKGLAKKLLELFTSTGKMLLEIGVLLAGAGLVVGVMSISGLGFNLAFILVQVGEYGLFWLLLASAIISIVLGMGLPSVAAYTLVAVLVAPAIVEFGVPPIAAHLFVYYYAGLSMFTPPIAICCFVAAPLAQASPNKIGIEAMKMGIVGYLVPFAFIYNSNLLIPLGVESSVSSMVLGIIFSTIACIIMSYAVVGFFVRNLLIWKRIALLICSIVMFMPFRLFGDSVLTSIVVLIVAVLILVQDWLQSRLSTKKEIGNLQLHE
jgi:TRAP transporter 4TM/12TM fusion protein